MVPATRSDLGYVELPKLTVREHVYKKAIRLDERSTPNRNNKNQRTRHHSNLVMYRSIRPNECTELSADRSMSQPLD